MAARKLLVIYTGGTIGMVPTDDGLAPSSFLEGLFRAFLPATIPDFDWLEFPVLLDSSNMSTKDWNHIGEEIANRYADYDGFIVLHGTDTMAYTASALSFILQDLDKPVVVTGSQLAISEKGSDAEANVILAFEAALSQLKEVSIAFGGKVMRGNRTIKTHTSNFAGFTSPNLARLNLQKRSSFAQGNFSFSAASEAPVSLVRLYPGMGAGSVAGAIAEDAKGLVIEAFGSGNLPSQSDVFMQALARVATEGLLIGVVSECRAGAIAAGRYAAGKALLDLGLTPLGDMTAPCAFAKISWLLGQDISHEARKEMLGTPLRGEMSLQSS